MMWFELNHKLSMNCRKGRKDSQARKLDRVNSFINFCRGKGVRGPDQIGRRHVYEWYEESTLADSTKLDRYYAIQLFWESMGRGDNPPYPRLSMPKKVSRSH